VSQFTNTDAVVLASRAMLAVISSTIAPALEHLSLAQFRALVVLVGAGPQRFGTLAARLNANTSTFSRTVDRLEKHGWVARVPNPESRREIIVEATEKARELVESVTDARRREIMAIFERIPEGRRQAVADAFEDFAAAAGEPAYEDLLPYGA
jgi:DNA-binding MarR family transcriptional regulator